MSRQPGRTLRGNGESPQPLRDSRRADASWSSPMTWTSRGAPATTALSSVTAERPRASSVMRVSARATPRHPLRLGRPSRFDMDHSTTFARHFARLVYLLLHEPKNIANQKAALRLLVAMSKEGEVTLTSRDWLVLANGSVVPQQLEGVTELGAQLIAHAVLELVAERNAVPADLLGAARALATEPVPGGEGESISDKLVASGAKTVWMKLGGNAPLPRAVGSPPPASSTVATPEKTGGNGASRNTQDMVAIPPPTPAPAAPAAPPTAAAPRRLSMEIGFMRGLTDGYLSQLAAPNATPGTISEEFSQLDATTSVTEITRMLDAIASSAEAAFREGNAEMLAVIMAGIVKREEKAADANIKRAYGAAVRRLAKKAMLSPIAECTSIHYAR